MDLIEHFSFCPEPLCIVIEFVSGGSLDKILRDSHVQTQSGDPAYTNIWSKLTERELLSIASDVANGMKHLESKQVSRTMALQVRSLVVLLAILWTKKIARIFQNGFKENIN